MKDIINTLQVYQVSALENGMSFDLDISTSDEETKAFVTVRSTIAGDSVDDQRYMKVSISTDDEPSAVEHKLECVNNFIYQVSTSLNYKTKE